MGTEATFPIMTALMYICRSFLASVICVSAYICRYLLHIFMEAGCLDWCVVIGLILRESSVINQILVIIQSSEVDGEMLQNIKTGLHAVDRWASTDW